MLNLIRKLWVKFDGLDIQCVCNEGNKKCTLSDKPTCSEYVVKFTPIERFTERRLSKSPKYLADKRRKLSTELNKTVKHLNKISKRFL